MGKIKVVKFLAKRMGENIEREASLNSIINILSIILLIANIFESGPVPTP